MPIEARKPTVKTELERPPYGKSKLEHNQKLRPPR